MVAPTSITTTELQAQMQLWADQLAREFDISAPPIRIADRKQARANRRYITMPLYLVNEPTEQRQAFVAHELAHYVPGCMNHGPKFKEWEDRLLAFFDLRVVRPRAYATSLWKRVDGYWEMVWEHPVKGKERIVRPDGWHVFVDRGTREAKYVYDPRTGRQGRVLDGKSPGEAIAGFGEAGPA